MINFIKKLLGLNNSEEDEVPNYLNGVKKKTAPKKKRTATRKKVETTSTKKSNKRS